jgi:hypothetical protein
VDQWLDEVRTQRRAWEERRRAAKDAADARRRRIDPWGAAQQEAREQESKRRRDAFRETIEREREAFRNSGPWAMQPTPRQESPPQLPTANDPTAPGGENASPPEPYPPLPGWDNRWYYRGF